MKKIFTMVMGMMIVGLGLHYPAYATIGSYVSEQLNAFKQLPSALQNCLINKNCTLDQKKMIVTAGKRLGIAIAAFVAVAAMLYAGSKCSNRSKDENKKIPFNKLAKESQQSVLENMVLYINKRKIDFIKRLLSEVQFNKNQLDDYLMLAVQSADAAIVKIFLNHGASAQTFDLKKNSLLYWAARRTMFSTPGQGEYEDAVAIIDILLSKGVPINQAGEDGRTPLMWVAKNKKLVERLRRYGADRSVRDNDHLQAVDYATDEEIKKLLRLKETVQSGQYPSR